MKRSLIFLLLFLSLPFSSWAKRIDPRTILPVDDGIYRFAVIHDFPACNQSSCLGGHVVCFIKATGQKRWEKLLYRFPINPSIEEDNQWVFIKKMYLDENRLVLQDERGKWFVLEKSTGKELHVNNFLKKADRPFDCRRLDDRIRPIIKDGYLITGDKTSDHKKVLVRAFDLATGRLLWDQEVLIPPRDRKQKYGWIYMSLYQGIFSIGFYCTYSKCFDIKTGKLIN